MRNLHRIGTKSDPPEYIDIDVIAEDYISAEEWRDYASYCDAVRYNPALVKRYEKRNAAPDPMRFLVGGLIPKGCVSLIVGAGGVGKTSVVTEPGLTVARGGGKDWCGFHVPADECQGLSVIICGEDPESSIRHRLALMGAETPPAKLFFYGNGSPPLDQILNEIDGARISLLAVDPARKYLKKGDGRPGDENDSGDVSEFFDKLERFAVKKKCAAVGVHHTQRNVKLASVADARRYVRGSGVFIDRPRAFIGVIRKRNETMIGLPKHNLPDDLAFPGVRRLKRDPTTHRHFLVRAAASPARGPKMTEEDQAGEVLAAISRLNSENMRVTKTGKNSLYQLKPEEVRTFSRRSLEETVTRLLEDGQLVISDDQALTVSKFY